MITIENKSFKGCNLIIFAIVFIYLIFSISGVYVIFLF